MRLLGELPKLLNLIERNKVAGCAGVGRRLPCSAARSRQVQVNRERRRRAEDFCGACREQPIARDLGRYGETASAAGEPKISVAPAASNRSRAPSVAAIP